MAMEPYRIEPYSIYLLQEGENIAAPTALPIASRMAFPTSLFLAGLAIAFTQTFAPDSYFVSAVIEIYLL